MKKLLIAFALFMAILGAPRSGDALLNTANFAFGKLTQPIPYATGAGATFNIAPNVNSGTFPTSNFLVVIYSSVCNSASNCPSREIMLISSVNGNTFTIGARDQEGTAHYGDWSTNDNVVNVVTAGTLNGDILELGALLNSKVTTSVTNTFTSYQYFNGITVSGSFSAQQIDVADPRCGGNLATCDTLATSLGKGLVCASTYTINSAVTVTSHMDLKSGCSLTGSGSINFVVQPTIGDYHVFGNITVTGLREANPIWFGAFGDGATDDTVAFNNAISATSKLIVTAINGGTETIYMIAATGSGASGDNGGLIITKPFKLQLENNVTLMAIPGNKTTSQVVSIESTSNVEIFGGTIIGDKYTNPNISEQGSLINIINTSRVYVHDITLTHAHGDCVRSVATNTYPSNQLFERVTFNEPRRWGLSFSGGGDLTVRDCIFSNATTSLSFGGAADVEDAYAIAYGGASIKNILFEHNQFLDNASPNGSVTIQAHGNMDNVKFLNNKFDNSTYGINASGPMTSLLIQGNNFSQITNSNIIVAGNLAGVRQGHIHLI